VIVPGSPGDDDLGLPDLMAMLDLEPLDTQLFRSQPAGEPGHRLFGGQVAAQALVAAERTTAQAARAHSLHAYFLRPGETGQPVVFQVDPLQDGRTFSRRRVTAIQGGRPILCLETSFTTDQASTNTDALTLLLELGSGQAHLITHQPGDLFSRVIDQLPDRPVLNILHE